MKDRALEKSKEVNEIYNDLKIRIEMINEKNKRLEEEFEKIKDSESKIIIDLANENVIIEQKKQERDNLINSNSSNTKNGKSKSNAINHDLINSLCKKSLDKFIGEYSGGFNENNNLFFNIQSGSIIISKKLTDPLLTFEGLKKEVAQQFNKSIEDIYFADENDNIMLNNMIVKNMLFPLDNICLRSYVPHIKIIDPKKEYEEKREVVNDNQAKVETIIIQNKKSEEFLSDYERLKKWFGESIYILIHIIFLIIFIFLFIFSTANFKSQSELTMIYASFKPYLSAHFESQVIRENLMSNIKKGLSDMFHFPTSQEVFSGTAYSIKYTNRFNQFNKNLFKAKIVQKIGNSSDCYSSNTSSLINNNISSSNSRKTSCYSYTEKTINFTEKFTGIEYLYESNSNNIYKGILNDYDTSGYYKIIPIFSPNEFYNTTNELDDLQWINSDCFFVSLTVNFYNFNLDSLIIFHLYYEKIGLFYYPTTKFSEFNKHSLFDATAIATFFFGLMTFITSFFMIKKDESTKTEAIKTLSKKYEKYLEIGRGRYDNDDEDENFILIFLRRNFFKVKFFFERNFNRPDLFFYISK